MYGNVDRIESEDGQETPGGMQERFDQLIGHPVPKMDTGTPDRGHGGTHAPLSIPAAFERR